MFDYFKNIASKNTCNSGGICSIHPSVNSLYANILFIAAEISFYLVKMKEFGCENKNILNFLIQTLSIFLINTSFNHKKYLSLILELDTARKEVREKYSAYCKKNNLSFEIINSDFEITSYITISKLIEYSQNLSANRRKCLDKGKTNLFELIILMTKLAAVNLVKIKKLDSSFDKYDFEIIRFFALCYDYSLRNEKIIRRVLEFSKIAKEIKEKLNKIYIEKFGQKESAKVNLTPLKGHNILVSGDDLDELDDLLKAIKNYPKNEKINVYTNGALFLAHFYPHFKNNEFLKGHYGTDSAEYDFSNFLGVILITQNFVQKIDSLYRGEIFCNKLISFTKVIDIQNKDYLPLIETSLNLPEYDKNSEIAFKEVNYDKEKFNNLNLKSNERLVIVVGNKNFNNFDEYKNGKTIFINSTVEGNLFIEKLNDFQKNDIKLSVLFLECNLSNLDLLFILLHYKFEIYFASCPNILINPHVVEALKSNFNVKIV